VVVVLGVCAGGVSDVSDDVMKLHISKTKRWFIVSDEVVYDVIRPYVVGSAANLRPGK